MSDVSVRLTLQEDVSSKLSRVSSAARTSVTQLQQAGQQIDRAFSSNSPEQFASSLGNAMDRAASSMDSLGDSVGQAMEELEQSSAVDFSEGFESAADGADELTRAAEDAGESIGSLSESTESLGDSVDGLGDGDGLGNLGESADEAGASMGEAEGKANSLADSLKKLFAVVSMAAVLSQVGKYASDAIDIGKDYTAMMSEVQALSGATGSDLALLQNTAREYGATTVFSATEAAEALKYMSLHKEVLRKNIDGYVVVSDTKIRYSCTLTPSELAGEYISEVGLYDAQGDFVALKAFMKKGKDGDMETTFECDDTF